MPNMIEDGLLDSAIIITSFSNNPTNADYKLQNAIQTAIGNAAQNGLKTVAVATAAFDIGLVQFMIPRLINLGYLTATLSGTTLTVTWS